MAKLVVAHFTDRDEAEQHYLAAIDLRAEQERARYITAGSGQAMTYEQKYREALHGDGPLLQAEAAALGVTVAQVAASVIQAHDAWLSAGAAIEARRLGAKRDVRLAQTPAEMHAILSALSF